MRINREFYEEYCKYCPYLVGEGHCDKEFYETCSCREDSKEEKGE